MAPGTGLRGLLVCVFCAATAGGAGAQTGEVEFDFEQAYKDLMQQVEKGNREREVMATELRRLSGDDWLTVCAVFVAKPPLNESAGRATAAALAVAPRVAWKGFSRLGPSVRPSVDVEGRLGSTRVSVGRASLRRSTRDRRVQP